MSSETWEYHAKDAIRLLLLYIGEDPDREGLAETPDRVVRAYDELFAGYKESPGSIFKTFEEPGSDEMIVLSGIDFCSMCEHHMMPFTGTATVAYIPSEGRIVGLSKLARLVDIYARRLQVQERMTRQITVALDTFLNPIGSACIVKATHMCMTCRGVSKPHAVMITSSLTGVFRDKPEVRAEFMQLGG